MPGYMITINNPEKSPKFKKGYMKYLVYQLEEGEETKTPHYQMYLQTFRRHTYDEIRQMLECPKASPQEQRQSATACRNYCMKLETRIEPPIEFGNFGSQVKGTMTTQTTQELVDEMYLDYKAGMTEYDLLMKYGVSYSYNLRHFKDYISLNRRIQAEQELTIQLMKLELKGWQIKIKDLFESQNDRTILWVFDKLGNRGKTILAKYLSHNKNDCLLIENAKKADIALVYNYEPKIIFDLARSTENKINYISIEKLKDGNVFSTKYNSMTKYTPSNKILVFSNFIPELEKLSEDRWQIVDLSGFKIWTEDEYNFHLEKQISNKNKPQQIQLVNRKESSMTKEDLEDLENFI